VLPPDRKARPGWLRPRVVLVADEAEAEIVGSATIDPGARCVRAGIGVPAPAAHAGGRELLTGEAVRPRRPRVPAARRWRSTRRSRGHLRATAASSTQLPGKRRLRKRRRPLGCGLRRLARPAAERRSRRL